MKKLLIIYILTGALISISNAQQWIGFSSLEPNAPELNLLTSNAQKVSFEVTIPGIYWLDTVVNGTTFSRLILLGGGTLNPAGYPEIPVLQYKIAIPNCVGVSVNCQVISTQPMPSCWVYPVPAIVLDKNENLVEQFTFEPAVYAIPRSPKQIAVITSDGALRAQRYVEITVQPIEFCPVIRQLSVIEKIEITLNFTNPQGDIRQNVGIFNKIATNAFINYEDDGMSASINDKAFEKEGFVPGNVQWVTLTDTAQAKNINADYLIICNEQFFTPQNADLQRLAEHRAFYNGFDVAIVNVENILELNFYYEGNPNSPYNWDEFLKEQKIRTFIRRVYEGANAQNTGDSCLAYVLLVGDNYEGNTGMPTSYDHNIACYSDDDDVYPSDYYFTCVTKGTGDMYDDVGDLLIGRLSVESDEHLYNMIQKTINHETDFCPESWKNKVGFTNGSVPVFPLYYSYYYNFLIDLLNDKEFNYSIVNFFELNGEIQEPTLNYLNNGVFFSQYYGHGSPLSWSETNLNIYNLELLLNNVYKNPFINAISCSTGMFDGEECIAEFLTRYDSIKGAVGYIGASRLLLTAAIIAPIDTGNLYFSERMPYYLFSKNISIAGELLWISKIINNEGYYLTIRNKHAYNLFGDPALNILAEGYEITRDVTADCSAKITCNVRIHNGATLTVSENCNLNFMPQGKLVIEENGNIDIQDNAQITGINNEVDTVIHVRGGGFTVGENVTFQDLSGGVLLGNARSPRLNDFYNDTKLYNLRSITFNNTPLTHRGSRLNISNCTFNSGSNLKTSASKSNIDSCIFNQAAFLADHTETTLVRNDMVPATTVGNSYFNGNNDSNTALQLYYSSIRNIYNNTITGYEKGISLIMNGGSLAQNPTDNIIHGNKVSDCFIGIELYNSTILFTSNHVYGNGFGIKLYNFSYTVFDNELEGVDQIIQDNNSFELYASANSFPTIFRYNQIVDENNSGNSLDDPLVYWDVSTPYSGELQDVRFNYWGESFDHEEDLYPPEAYLWDPVWDGSKSGMSAEILYKTGLAYFAEEDYKTAETIFKELIVSYPQSRFAVAAMHELVSIEYFLNHDFYRLHDYFASFTPSDSALFEVADFLAIRCLVKEKEWQPAIDWYENRIENPPSYQDSVFAITQDFRDSGVYNTTINVSGFPAGLYQYSLFINGEQTDAKKMMRY